MHPLFDRSRSASRAAVPDAPPAYGPAHDIRPNCLRGIGYEQLPLIFEIQLQLSRSIAPRYRKQQSGRMSRRQMRDLIHARNASACAGLTGAHPAVPQAYLKWATYRGPRSLRAPFPNQQTHKCFDPDIGQAKAPVPVTAGSSETVIAIQTFAETIGSRDRDQPLTAVETLRVSRALDDNVAVALFLGMKRANESRQSQGRNRVISLQAYAIQTPSLLLPATAPWQHAVARAGRQCCPGGARCAPEASCTYNTFIARPRSSSPRKDFARVGARYCAPVNAELRTPNAPRAFACGVVCEGVFEIGCGGRI